MAEQAELPIENKPETPTPPADDTAKKLAELEARAKAAEEKAAQFESDHKKKSAEQKRKEAEAKAAKMIEDGKAAEEIKRLQAQLEEATGRIEAQEKSHREKLDKMIDSLGDTDKAEINAIKDHLPLDKLEELVTLKSGKPAPTGDATPTPPSMTPGGTVPKERQFSNTALEVFDAYGTDLEMAKKATHLKNPRNPTDTKDVLPVKAMIEKLKSLAPPTMRLSKKELNRRKGQ